MVATWRTAASAAALAAGAAAITGSLLPWVTAFAGLVTVRGTRGSNGWLLAGAGALIAGTGLWHLARGGRFSRWAMGLLGVAVAGYAGDLLIRLSAVLGPGAGDSMMLLRGGPGLWVVAAGGLLAFATLFLPASEPPGGQRAGGGPAAGGTGRGGGPGGRGAAPGRCVLPGRVSPARPCSTGTGSGCRSAGRT
jgi:hypothetical protein